jgi:hypothetical protein
LAKKATGKPAQPPPDPEQLFRHALGFDYAGEILASVTAANLVALAKSSTRKIKKGSSKSVTVSVPRDKLSQIPPAIPMVVVQAFATEIYLKCVLLLNKAKLPRIHELLDLYRLLRPDQQIRMEELYNQEAQTDPAFQTLRTIAPATAFTLVYALTEMNKAFETWRYAYETPLETSFLGHPWKATGRLILEMRPDWQTILDSLPALPAFPIR